MGMHTCLSRYIGAVVHDIKTVDWHAQLFVIKDKTYGLTLTSQKCDNVHLWTALSAQTVDRVRQVSGSRVPQSYGFQRSQSGMFGVLVRPAAVKEDYFRAPAVKCEAVTNNSDNAHLSIVQNVAVQHELIYVSQLATTFASLLHNDVYLGNKIVRAPSKRCQTMVSFTLVKSICFQLGSMKAVTRIALFEAANRLTKGTRCGSFLRGPRDPKRGYELVGENT